MSTAEENDLPNVKAKEHWAHQVMFDGRLTTPVICQPHWSDHADHINHAAPHHAAMQATMQNSSCPRHMIVVTLCRVDWYIVGYFSHSVWPNVCWVWNIDPYKTIVLMLAYHYDHPSVSRTAHLQHISKLQPKITGAESHGTNCILKFLYHHRQYKVRDWYTVGPRVN